MYDYCSGFLAAGRFNALNKKSVALSLQRGGDIVLTVLGHPITEISPPPLD